MSGQYSGMIRGDKRETQQLRQNIQEELSTIDRRYIKGFYILRLHSMVYTYELG